MDMTMIMGDIQGDEAVDNYGQNCEIIAKKYPVFVQGIGKKKI